MFSLSQGKHVTPLTGLQRLQEGGLLCCCMLATFILLALSSFNPADPGWSQTSYQGDIHNLTGAVGAWLADVLFYFLVIPPISSLLLQHWPVGCYLNACISWLRLIISQLDCAWWDFY